MQVYQRKPVTAIQWDGQINTFKRLAAMWDPKKHWEDCIRGNDRSSPFDFNITTGTLIVYNEEPMVFRTKRPDKGDYILKNHSGNFEVVNQKIFEENYELLTGYSVKKGRPEDEGE